MHHPCIWWISQFTRGVTSQGVVNWSDWYSTHYKQLQTFAPNNYKKHSKYLDAFSPHLPIPNKFILVKHLLLEHLLPYHADLSCILSSSDWSICIVNSESPVIWLRKRLSTRPTMWSRFRWIRRCVSAGLDTGTSWICIEPIRVEESFGQNRGELCDCKPWTEESLDVCQRISEFVKIGMIDSTAVNACWMFLSRSAMSSASTFPVSRTRGITLPAISTAMNSEAIGSKPVHP